MILDTTNIKELIEKPKNKSLIDHYKERNLLYEMHVNGVNVTNFVSKLEGYENETQRKIREKVIISNIDLFSQLLRPVDKIYKASGGTVEHYLSSKDEFNEILGDVDDGLSLRDWLKNYWQKKYYTDPNGLILIETTEDGADHYPVYKSIQTIRDYEQSGRRIEYIIFEPVKEKIGDNEIEKCRVLDDVNDYMFIKDGENWRLIEEETFPMVLDEVPAVVISDIIDVVNGWKESIVKETIEVANKYLLTNSLKCVIELIHGYPIFWRYVEDCPTCHGTGLYDGANCIKCNGTGKKITKDISDIIGLEIPGSDETTIAPNVAGYVEPPLESWKEFRIELDWLKKIMFFSLWGTQLQEKEGNETATGRFIDSQPVNDRLNDLAQAAEDTERLITDYLGRLYFGGTYKGSTIKYSRRFQIESPDALWEKYEKAREKGATSVILDYHLKQYYDAEFANDIMQRTKVEKLLEVEPYVHMTIEEANNILTGDNLIKKLEWDNWISEISDNYILKTETKELKENFNTYIQTKKTNYGKESENRSEEQPQG